MDDTIKMLRDFLASSGMDQKVFAKKMGKSEVTLSRWLNGKANLTEANMNAIKFIICSYKKTPDDTAKVVHAGDLHRVSVPHLSAVQAAQSNPTAFPVPESEQESFNGFQTAEDGDFVLDVSGHSMEPWYPAGTLLLVKRNKIPKTGDRVAAAIVGRSEPIFKNYIDLGSKFALLSINEKDGLPPIIFDKMDRDSWNWIYPIGESIRNEFFLDECMKRHGIHHFWEDKIAELKAQNHIQ